jgi:hypothetical protein
MTYEREHTQEAIKQRGEVFTPPELVRDMLDKLPIGVFKDPQKTFLDNSCGNGAFLFAVMQRKIQNGPMSHKTALRTIYGVEIDPKNAGECRKRLLDGSKDKEAIRIVKHNIICADALNPKHKGWASVGYMWERSEALEKLENELSWAKQVVARLASIKKSAPKKSAPWIQQTIEKLRARHA